MSGERGSFRDLAAIIRANRAAGQAWFAPATMLWWDSRVESDVLRGCFFITSERPLTLAEMGLEEPPALGEPHPARAYSVRIAYADGTIETVGDFQEHATLGAALDAVAQLVGQDA